jgi:alanine racemase
MARAWAEISLEAVAANVATLAAHSAPAAVCAVVKADGYGHGAAPVARAAMEGGAAWLAVAQTGELAELRHAGVDAPLLLLADPAPSEVSAAVASGAALTAHRQDTIELLAAASSVERPTDVHLKVDTGMHRIGCRPEDVVDLAKAIDAAPSLRLAALWTHCAIADEPDDPFTALQLERFDAAIAEVEAAGMEVPLRHAANSAAAIAHPASRYDLVRCGIAVYGIPPSPLLEGRLPLRPALRLTTEVSSVRAVPAGDRVSYGLRHRFGADTVVATLPIGYADGVFRSLGVAGQHVLVDGTRRPMVGVVTMDQLMVDVGPDSDVAPGDEVVLLGAQGGERVSPDEWAARLGTIAYEVVCALGARVERRYDAS